MAGTHYLHLQNEENLIIINCINLLWEVLG